LSYFEQRASNENEQIKSDPSMRKYMYGAMAFIFPLLYCVLDGIGTFADALYLQHYMEEQEALLSYEFTFLIVALIALPYVKFIKKTKFFYHEEKWKALGAVAETIGQFTYVFALAGNAILAAPMIASFCVMSVILSRIFLKEKLAPKQYLAIFVVVIGIIILGIE
jgi:drug/metabolite transporter (DMT)-like permease